MSFSEARVGFSIRKPIEKTFITRWKFSLIFFLSFACDNFAEILFLLALP